MLTPLCLLACLCVPIRSPTFLPLQRRRQCFCARFAMIEKTAPDSASFYPPKTGYREAFYALPVARVNNVVLTAGQVLFRWIPYLETAAQQGGAGDAGKDH